MGHDGQDELHDIEVSCCVKQCRVDQADEESHNQGFLSGVFGQAEHWAAYSIGQLPMNKTTQAGVVAGWGLKRLMVPLLVLAALGTAAAAGADADAALQPGDSA